MILFVATAGLFTFSCDEIALDIERFRFLMRSFEYGAIGRVT